MTRVVLAVALLGAAAAAQAPPEETRIGALVDALGASDFTLREAAERELRAIGEPVCARLRAAATGHTDPEVRRRARRLLQLLGDLPEAVLATLRRDVLAALQETPDAAVAVPRLRQVLEDFRTAHPLTGDGEARVHRLPGGRLVLALGRGAPPTGGSADGGAASVTDPTAELVIAIGGNGRTAAPGGGAGGAAEARATAGLALALGGEAGDSRGEALPTGGFSVKGPGAGGPALAVGAAGDLAFPGRRGATIVPGPAGDVPISAREAAVLPAPEAGAWTRLREFAAARK